MLETRQCAVVWLVVSTFTVRFFEAFLVHFWHHETIYLNQPEQKLWDELPAVLRVFTLARLIPVFNSSAYSRTAVLPGL